LGCSSTAPSHCRHRVRATNRFNTFQLAGFALGLAFTLFFGFTSGTRNLFAAYLVTFIIGYAFASPTHRRKEVLILTTVGAVVMITATSRCCASAISAS
jgi:hypothetical protein